jgi:hypothetical protein
MAFKSEAEKKAYEADIACRLFVNNLKNAKPSTGESIRMKNKNNQPRAKNHTGTIFFSICVAFVIGPGIVGATIRMTTPQVTTPPTIENNIPAPAEVAKPAEVATPDDAESKAWEKHYNGLSQEEKVKALNALIYEPTEPPNRFLPNGAR